MATCNCESCKLSRRIRRTKQSGSHRQKNTLINELADLYRNTDADLEYENAIKYGSWPNSVEILAWRLKNAINKDEDYPLSKDILTKLFIEAIAIYEQKEMLKKLER